MHAHFNLPFEAGWLNSCEVTGEHHQEVSLTCPWVQLRTQMIPDCTINVTCDEDDDDDGLTVQISPLSSEALPLDSGVVAGYFAGCGGELSESAHRASLYFITSL